MDILFKQLYKELNCVAHGLSKIGLLLDFGSIYSRICFEGMVVEEGDISLCWSTYYSNYNLDFIYIFYLLDYVILAGMIFVYVQPF